MIQSEVICGNMQRGVDVGASAVTLLVMGVPLLFIGEDALDVLESSMGAYDESS